MGLRLYPDLEAYIDHNYVHKKREEEYGDRYFGSVAKSDPKYDAYLRDREQLETRLNRRAQIFAEAFVRFVWGISVVFDWTKELRQCIRL